MGKVIIGEETTKYPLQVIGKYAGICWGADVSIAEKNIKRAKDCIKKGHGRTLEFPQIYMILDEYSARVIREYYTHIGGDPIRLQESTRYVDCTNFKYITPPSIGNNPQAKALYDKEMHFISDTISVLENKFNIPREDSAMLLPLGMETKIVVRTDLRNLIDMSRNRDCSRAYWEFRKLMKNIEDSLSEISDEWTYIIKEEFKPKCEVLGYCPENNSSCKRKPNKVGD